MTTLNPIAERQFIQMKAIKKVFDSKEDAEDYCRYGGDYKMVYELFV